MSLKISAEAEAIRAVLATYATPLGGQSAVVANLSHLWEFIAGLSDQPTMVVCYNGENIRGGFATGNKTYRVDRQWVVVILRGHGWRRALTTGDTAPQEKPFYDILEEVRDLLRCQYQLTEEPPLDYRAIKAVPNLGPDRASNVFLDAYQIEFSTAQDIPMVQGEAGTYTFTIDGERYMTVHQNLPAGETTGRVTGLALAAAPLQIHPTVLIPSGGESIDLKVLADTITPDGFDFELTGTPEQEGYIAVILIIPQSS